MPLFGSGHEVVTSLTRPASPIIGQMIYQTDTDEFLKYVSYGGANRWMQAVPKPNRNLIINGDFGVAQRSTGSVALTNTAAYCGVDRWMSFQVGTAQSTQQQVTTALPTQATNGVSFKSGVRIGRNVGSTNTAYITLFTAMETVDCVKAQGKKVTLSFWMKGGAGLNLSGNSVSVVVNSGTGTDQSNSSQMSWTGVTRVIQTSAVVSSSWQYFTYTGTVPASATQLGVYVYPLTFGAAAAIADDNVYFTGMQLEIGSAPSEFEFEPFETTLRKCQRYFVGFRSGASNTPMGVAGNQSAGLAYAMTTLPTTMRRLPSVSFSAFGGITIITSAGAYTVSAVSSVFNITANNLTIYFTCPTPSGHGMWRMSASIYMSVSAEL
jgi:hypothetical protein